MGSVIKILAEFPLHILNVFQAVIFTGLVIHFTFKTTWRKKFPKWILVGVFVLLVIIQIRLAYLHWPK